MFLLSMFFMKAFVGRKPERWARKLEKSRRQSQIIRCRRDGISNKDNGSKIKKKGGENAERWSRDGK